MNKALFTVLAIILVLAIAGGSFYGGMVYGKSQAQANITAAAMTFQNAASGTTVQGNGPQGLPGGMPGMPGGGFAARAERTSGQGTGMVMGTIKEITADGLVLTDSNGKETQIKVTDTTLIEKNASVQLTDLTEGETLVVSGSTAADGTVTARSVQVAQAGRFGMGGGEGRPGAPGDGQGQPAEPMPAPQSTPAQ